MKFGIYEDYGTSTCGGYPGMAGHLETDAQTFADWEVDYLKIDGCNWDAEDLGNGIYLLPNIYSYCFLFYINGIL